MADEVADGHEATVRKIHQHIQWTTVEAITAMTSLPGKGEIYIGDHQGQPKALHGIMDAIHEIRHERYIMHRDNTDGIRFYWQDNTIGFLASVFNGNSKAAGHHVHTEMMLYDKHCGGCNRTKNTKLSEDE